MSDETLGQVVRLNSLVLLSWLQFLSEILPSEEVFQFSLLVDPVSCLQYISFNEPYPRIYLWNVLLVV